MSGEVATRETGPAALIEQYRSDFTALLPAHVVADAWMGAAVGAIRRDPKLAQAWINDPAAGMVALKESATLGLRPGSEEYYLTVRKERGTPKVKGIIGYQGWIELIYRAGAVSSVRVEVVRERDLFSYTLGVDDRPRHTIDWFGGDRGALVGVYAYAIMRDGATSQVVVLNRAQVLAAKAKSDGASSTYSPWNDGDGEAMWRKTAVRRLVKWIPTSAEYIREQLRAVRDVASEAVGTTTLPVRSVDEILDDDPLHYEPDEYVDAEIVDDNALEQGEGTA